MPLPLSGDQLVSSGALAIRDTVVPQKVSQTMILTCLPVLYVDILLTWKMRCWRCTFVVVPV